MPQLLALSDSQMDGIMRAAEPLRPIGAGGSCSASRRRFVVANSATAPSARDPRVREAPFRSGGGARGTGSFFPRKGAVA